MKKFVVFFFCISLFMTVFSGNKPMLILTEDGNHPLNFINKDGTVSGCVVDVVKEIQKRTGDKTEIKVWPWKRALTTAIESDEYNVILFSTTFTEERDKYFKWIGPVKHDQWYLWVKKDSTLKVNSLEDMKKLDSIGTYLGDVMETFLLDNGFKNVKSVNEPVINLRKLYAGKIDGWVAGGGSYVPELAKKENISIDEIKKIYTIKESYLYIAVSKKASDDIFIKWKKAFEDMKKDGTLKKIYKKWNFDLPLNDPLASKK